MQPINLNKARKQKQRTDRRRSADENAVKSGRTKAERVLVESKEALRIKRLDQVKRESE